MAETSRGTGRSTTHQKRAPERNSAELVANFKEFCRVLSTIEQPDLMEQLLRQLLTRAEVNEVAGRWELVKLLDSGLSQRRIAEELGMSLCKITRGSRELKKPGSSLKAIIQEYIPRSSS
jgi:TrpR family trp operon transcriptional repressor